MKRAIPVVVLSIAGLVPVWRYEPSTPVASPSVSASAGSSSGTGVKGPTVQTEKGPVQVQVTFDGDKITAVRMLQQPNHPQTTAAVPKLVAETLKVQSADIDTVSGATITSNAYKKSLQAAIDADRANPKSSKSASDSSDSSESSSSSDESGGTVSGPTVNTVKGPVQVQVTFGEDDEITAVRMLQQPDHPQTTAAVPKLIAATLKAQSADIDTVSGATITSGAYRKSLQAALDAEE
ncbi:FMN-binding protein [Streptomyces guryensis]|uniref:FMN-binding protein n=1 Tax=Streptomyces guryensis TaxID=2886947 RepID=A0A9Q3VL89_9ACTN|nr:FMN-binding protein [Streptomyces guryensis]MCD9873081.1 FMN-binding protein [Streptomyces guryensis]